MPYKIVQTIENGQIKLTAVPEQWENEGILKYPLKKIEKLRKNESSIPKESWVSINCIVKRMNLTFIQAETELRKMCNTSDTESDVGDDKSSKRMITNTPKQPECTSNTNNFNQLAEECLNNSALYSAANIEDEVAVTTAYNTSEDAGPVQFSIPEIPLRKAPLNDVSYVSGLESKLDVLVENVKLLSENVVFVQSNQQELYKIQQEILLALANINIQFEEFIKKVQKSEVKENRVNFKRISDQESFDNFEKMLESESFAKTLKQEMSAICGRHRGKGINNAYALIDVMFDRIFLNTCSWAGGTRTMSSKVCFKTHSNTVKFFFDVIHEADNNFTFVDTQNFFKVILRNSRQRCESQQKRTSMTKTKIPRNKLNQSQLVHEPNLDIPEQSHTGSQQTPKSLDTELPTLVPDGELVTAEQSALVSKIQPTVGQLIRPPQFSNTEPLVQEFDQGLINDEEMFQ